MKMELIKKIEYKKDYRIHIMQFGYVFQYLISDKKGNIFQDNIDLKPNLWNRLKYSLGFSPSPYPEDQFEVGVNIILSGAMGTVDALLKQIKDAEDEREMLRQEAKKRNITKCNWRAMTGPDGKVAYQCLTHPEYIVQMHNKDDKPFHDLSAQAGKKGENGILSPLQFHG